MPLYDAMPSHDVMPSHDAMSPHDVMSSGRLLFTGDDGGQGVPMRYDELVPRRSQRLPVVRLSKEWVAQRGQFDVRNSCCGAIPCREPHAWEKSVVSPWYQILVS